MALIYKLNSFLVARYGCENSPDTPSNWFVVQPPDDWCSFCVTCSCLVAPLKTVYQAFLYLFRSKFCFVAKVFFFFFVKWANTNAFTFVNSIMTLAYREIVKIRCYNWSDVKIDSFIPRISLLSVPWRSRGGRKRDPGTRLGNGNRSYYMTSCKEKQSDQLSP